MWSADVCTCLCVCVCVCLQFFDMRMLFLLTALCTDVRYVCLQLELNLCLSDNKSVQSVVGFVKMEFMLLHIATSTNSVVCMPQTSLTLLMSQFLPPQIENSSPDDHCQLYALVHSWTYLMWFWQWHRDTGSPLLALLWMCWCPKGKGSPYSITKRRVPELIPVLGSQPADDVSHKAGGRLPLLSARPAVTHAALKRMLPILLLGEQRHSGCKQSA